MLQIVNDMREKCDIIEALLEMEIAVCEEGVLSPQGDTEIACFLQSRPFALQI